MNGGIIYMAQGKITAKQTEVLEFIKQEILKRGYPPTVRDICEAVNLKSTSSVHAHLETLEAKGYIRKDPTKPRAIEICDDGFNMVRTEIVSIPVVGQVAAGMPILAEENIDSYVFQMLKNFALRRRVRETIDSELGLEDGRVNISKYLKVDAEEFDGLDEELHDFDTDDEPKQTDEDETNNCYSLDDDGECEDDETQNDTLIDDTDVPEDKILAEKRIEGLFNLMRNQDQAELLRKVMLYGYDRVELAEEMGCSRAVLDNRVSRAMMDLYEVALPQIRQECKHMVITNRDALTDEYQRDILNDYFFSNNTLKELAQAYGMNEADFTKDLIKAYKEIKSISKKTIRVFVSDKDIEKYKEEERKQEATSTLRIKFTTLKL